MLDILSAMYHDDPPMLKTLSSLENPQSVEEQKIVTQLRAVDEKIAEALAPSIEALAAVSYTHLTLPTNSRV